MSEPDMYPLVDNPTYTEEFDNFAELREQAERMLGPLNFPLSWFITDGRMVGEGGDEGEESYFQFCIFMPRKSATTVWATSVFDRREVEAWLNGYVRVNVHDWYGWAVTA